MLNQLKSRLGLHHLGLKEGQKVDFLICGAQKSGTSALNKYLAAHPGVCVADKKEVHYFDRDEFFVENKPDYEEYHSSFSGNTQNKRVGEATPIYMYWEQATKRIWEYNPQIKLILMLRNPIDRAYSHWNMERYKGKESLPFLEAVEMESVRRQNVSPLQDRVYSYLDRGYYLNQLKRINRYFPANQVLVLKYDDYRDRPDNTLNKICDFLNISRLKNVKNEIVYARPYITNMTVEEREAMAKIYEAEIRGLEKLLDWDCSKWLGLSH